MAGIFSKRIKKSPQDDALATLAPPVKKSEGRVDWELPARILVNKLRAFTPWPGLSFLMGNRLIKIIRAGSSDQQHQAPAGNILGLDAHGLNVACGQGTVLEITSMQPEGKKEMSPWQYSLGNRFPENLA
jgi:methionyl-tRNA formyltransferase